MTIDKFGRELIYTEEGVRLKAYKCAAGIPTIGVGCTYYQDGTKVKMGDVITPAECDSLFTKIVKDFENVVNKSIKVKISQNQFNALVSLAFNIGIKAFAGSTLVKVINTLAPIVQIAKWFLAWNKAGGKPILLNRRKREFKIYNN